MRKVVADYKRIIIGTMGFCTFNNVLFLSYFLSLTPSMNGFVKLPLTHCLVNLIVMSVFILSELC